MPDDLAIVDMKGFYSFPWGRGKVASCNSKADRTLQNRGTAGQEKDREMAPTGQPDGGDSDDEAGADGGGVDGAAKPSTSSAAVGGPEGDESEADLLLEVDSAEEIVVKKCAREEESSQAGLEDEDSRQSDSIVLQYKDGELKTVSEFEEMVEDSQDGSGALMKTRGTKGSADNLDDGTDANTVSGSKTSEKGGSRDVDAGQFKKKLTVKEKNKVCEIQAGPVKVTEFKSKVLSIKDKNVEKLEMKDDDFDETCTFDYDEPLNLVTPRCHVEFQKYEEAGPEADFLANSSIASRTFVTLRRAEGVSFEEIRVFNAQDNFVLKSCAIQLKFRRSIEAGMSDKPRLYQIKDGNKIEAFVAKSGLQEIQIEKDLSAAGKKTPQTNQEKQDNTFTTNKEKETKEKDGIQKFILSKEKMKEVWIKIQRLLPFSVSYHNYYSGGSYGPNRMYMYPAA